MVDASRRGVVLTSSAAAIERMADQLRGEGLEVTTDPDARARRATQRARELAAVGASPSTSPRSSSGARATSPADGASGDGRARERAPSTASSTTSPWAATSCTASTASRDSRARRRARSTGSTRDYLILEFKDGRSYWPTEQIDALTPYTGGDSPALSRMGGAEWQKTRAKARAAAFLVAQELVDLYRLRTVAEGHAFSPDTRVATRDGRTLSLHSHRRPGPGDRRREGRHGVTAPDGPARSAPTWASARPKWRCARCSRRCRTTIKRRCSCRRRCSRASTSPPSASDSRAFR